MANNDSLEKLNALILGGGSIGMRHLKNLKFLGLSKLTVIEPDSKRHADIQEAGAFALSNIKDIKGKHFDFIVIATPTHLHVDQLLDLYSSADAFFIEKPLAHTETALAKLSSPSAAPSKISLIGCNMRFHPGPKLVRELLDKDTIGKVLFAQYYMGYSLPLWRPKIDYRKSYSAQEAMGGGCVLDCIHEIDLARWMLGEVTEVEGRVEHTGHLEIDTEDLAILICKHSSHALSQVSLDYLQPNYSRGCRIVGEKGSLLWDLTEGEVKHYNAETLSWQKFPEPKNWQMNQMYLDEMSYFLNCIQAKQQTFFPIEEATKVCKIAFALKTSSKSGKRIILENKHAKIIRKAA